MRSSSIDVYISALKFWGTDGFGRPILPDSNAVKRLLHGCEKAQRALSQGITVSLHRGWFSALPFVARSVIDSTSAGKKTPGGGDWLLAVPRSQALTIPDNACHGSTSNYLQPETVLGINQEKHYSSVTVPNSKNDYLAKL